MTTITIKGAIFYDTWFADHGHGSSWQFLTGLARDTKLADKIFVRAHEFEVEVPDDFDPRPAQSNSLQAIEHTEAA